MSIKRLLIPVLLVCLCWRAHAQTNASPLKLIGIIYEPDHKYAVLSHPERIVIEEGQKQRDIEIVKINPETSTVNLKSVNSSKVLDLVIPSDTAVRQTNVPTDRLIEFYSMASDRTALQAVMLPRFSLSLVSVTNKTDFARVIAEALTLKGICVIPDGEKFVMIVPESMKSIAVPHSAEISSPIPAGQSPQIRMVHSGEIDLPNVSTQSLAQLYSWIVARQLDPTKPIPQGGIYKFKTQNALTLNQVKYAFDTLLSWQNLQVVSTGTNLITVQSIPRK